MTEPVEGATVHSSRLWRSSPPTGRGLGLGLPSRGGLDGGIGGRSTKNSMRSGLLKDLLVVLAVYAAGQVSVLAASELLVDKRDHKMSALTVTVSYIIGGLSMILALRALIRRRKIPIKSVLYFKRPGFKDIGMIFLGFGMYFAILAVVFMLIKTYIPAINLEQKQEIGLGNVSSALLPLVYLSIAILPPLSEEMMFRGFFLSRLRHHKVGKWASAIVVSLLFALSHGQLNVGIDTFILSMVMIYVLDTRKNLWISVGIHMLKNTIAFLGLFVFKLH
jgi:membrane protease YdiL (CAAX protease family)